MLDELRAQVRQIPRGRVMTYGEVAAAAGHPGAARQVVWALRNCGPNVPWHRVVGAGLKIRLPGEAGLEQRLRLESEGWLVVGARLRRRSESK
jgi:methylated-DNA-protein-cysteine methyltransferase-like protein